MSNVQFLREALNSQRKQRGEEEHRLLRQEIAASAHQCRADAVADGTARGAAQTERQRHLPALAKGADFLRGAQVGQQAQHLRRGRRLDSGDVLATDAALSETVRAGYLPDSTLKGSANLLVLPNLDVPGDVVDVASGDGALAELLRQALRPPPPPAPRSPPPPPA